jgi:large subunit ribosomal protein L25
MDTINIEGVSRSLGSKSSKEIRRAGQVPCVLYGQDANVHFSVTPKSVKPLVYTPDFKLAEIDIEGKKIRSIIKDIQFHPVTDAIQHIDFLQLTDGVPVKVSIPLKTKGESEGVKVGGKLLQQVRKVLVDISSLELGQSARIRDIEVNENMQIMNPSATPVVMVEVPRALKSAQASEGDDDASADVAAPAAE